MVLQVYGHPKSTAARLVALICKEKEIPYEVVLVDHFKGQNKLPEHLKHQPFGQTPYIIDDDFVLYESRAIARYLIRKYPKQGTAGLVPTELQQESLFEQAAQTEVFHFNPNSTPLIWEKVIKKMKGLEPDTNKVDECLKKLDACLDAYEIILSDQKYLAGENLTLADLQHLPNGTMLFAGGLGEVLLKRPNVARWWKEISSRPSWEAVRNGA